MTVVWTAFAVAIWMVADVIWQAIKLRRPMKPNPWEQDNG